MSQINHIAVTLLSKAAAAPAVRAWLWRRWYEDLARKFGNREWTCMNYGFWDEATQNLPLSEDDAPHRPFLGLYERVTRGTDLEGKTVLEVGSGRGGGASYLARTKNPKRMLGIDYSENAARLSQKLHDAPNLRFRQGDATNLPLPAQSFDVVVNVESSHCYSSVPAFLGEVARVLRPGGTFCWCDMRKSAEWPEARAQFGAAGLEIIEEEAITPFVLKALDEAAPEKERLILSKVPLWMRPAFEDFAGMPHSKVYHLLQSGEVAYMAIRAIRK